MTVRSPITNSTDVTLLKTIQTDQVIHDWQSSFQMEIAEEFHGHKEIYLYQCNQTRMKFFVPFELAGSENLYKQLQKFDWYYMSDKWEYQVALKDLSACNQILEIGSGFGAFVKLGMNAGLNIRGIELNKLAVLAAQGDNLPVAYLALRKAADLYAESLDGICSFQVLEHVSNPKDFINCAIKTLKPGGKLILSVPNAESFLKHGYCLLDMPPHHMHQWSEETFKSLERFYPIKLEKIMFEPLAKYHISVYISTYAHHYRSKSFLGKLLFNRYTIPAYGKSLALGLRNLFRGQTLYAQFCKL